MENFQYQSTLETLPDEILLEICKYLLCTDILFAFVNLNNRMTQMITQYRHNVSLYKASLTKSNYFYVNILPHIGSQIRSLLIDCCYSILQDNLFIKYCDKKMPILFPRLERISLISYQYNQLMTFFNNLHDLDRLVEIRLYSIFPIQYSHRPTLVRSLFRANNERLTTILINDESSALHFEPNDCYYNVIRLRITLRTIFDLESLVSAVPNVQCLEVTIEGNVDVLEYFDALTLSTLCHLTDFKLISIKQSWKLEDLLQIFSYLPKVRCLSLFLFTSDRNLIESDIILALLPLTIQQFDYAIFLLHDIPFKQIDHILTAWPSSHPVTGFYKDKILFMHTLPWHFARISTENYLSNISPSTMNNRTGYDSNVEQLEIKLDGNFTLKKSLAMILQCSQMREITIYSRDKEDTVEEEPYPIVNVSKLSRLLHVGFYGSIPCDLDHFSFILNVARNIFRLDLPFNFLWKLINNQQICHLLGQRITSLSVLDTSMKSSLIILQEEHIPLIASIFYRLRDIYMDFMHLPQSSTAIVSNNNPNRSTEIDQHIQSDQEECHVTAASCSSKSMLTSLLKEFKDHKLISLCIAGHFLEEIKINPKQWLQYNSVLYDQTFEAVFSTEIDRLLIWM